MQIWILTIPSNKQNLGANAEIGLMQNANIKDDSKPKSISSAAENDLETIIKRAKDWQKKKYEVGWARSIG